MLTATLGGLIKDYRLRKRLSQLDVSLRIGWKDTTRLSKIEQGRVGKPTRQTAEKIISALDLDEQEKGEFLLVGGYLPTDQEIKKIVKQVKGRIENWPHPAYLIDFSWRMLYSNLATQKIFEIPESIINSLPKQKPNLLEFAFAPKEVFPLEVKKGDNQENLEAFPVAQIIQFKIEHKGREDEKWYKDLINKMKANENFREIWKNMNPLKHYKTMLDYEYKVIGYPNGNKKTYHIFSSKLIKDQRFQVILYQPE